jgi:HSP20 family molecular chaperone IbpA
MSFRDEPEVPITARYRSRSRSRKSTSIAVLTPAEKEELQARSFSAVENEVFKARLDMIGFTNEEISLDLKGRFLTVSGTRKRDGLNTRKTTETVEIPLGVNLESLKVARQADGTLIIQEAPINDI